MGVVFWLMLPLATYVGSKIPFIGLALAIVGGIGFFICVMYALFYIRCPSCNVSLGQAAARPKDINFCHKCGLDLNEEI